jgi:hypothetical protein
LAKLKTVFKEYCVLNDKQKLFALFRLEPGCLGPEGKSYIEDFCVFAKAQDDALPYVHIEVVARYDKTLPEWEYSLASKRLSDKQLARFLALFDDNQSDFESRFEERLGELIEVFFNR